MVLNQFCDLHTSPNLVLSSKKKNHIFFQRIDMFNLFSTGTETLLFLSFLLYFPHSFSCTGGKKWDSSFYETHVWMNGCHLLIRAGHSDPDQLRDWGEGGGQGHGSFPAHPIHPSSTQSPRACCVCCISILSTFTPVCRTEWPAGCCSIILHTAALMPYSVDAIGWCFFLWLIFNIVFSDFFLQIVSCVWQRFFFFFYDHLRSKNNNN